MLRTKLAIAVMLLPFLLLALSIKFNVAGNTKTTGNHAEKVSYASHSFDVFRVDSPYTHIRMFWKDDHGNRLRSLANLKSYVEGKGQTLVFATNGGMYMPDNSPLGLYVEHGKEQHPIDLRKSSTGNFYMQPNGVFLLTKTTARVVTSNNYQKWANKTVFATRSGPMLVINGTANPKFTKGSANVYIRSGVGINNQGQVVFAISNEPVNFYDFAMLFKDSLHCNDALYLDGAISRMYLPQLNRPDLGGDFGVMIGVVE